MTRATFDTLGWTRDMVQARILARLFSQRVRGIALKGGMAMRVAHGKWARATKDIDLDADQELPLPALQSLMRKAIATAAQDTALENVRITEPKQTETTSRWKIAGTDPRTGQVLNLTVEVSRRDAVSDNAVRQVCQGPTGDDWITVYKDEELAFKKVKALLSDMREAPRDIADLYLLIQADVPAPVAQLRTFMAEGGELSLRRMWSKIERMDQAMFRAEVLPSLPPTPDGQDLYRDWEEIRVTVGENIERWIRQAREEQVPEQEPVGNRHLLAPRARTPSAGP